MWMHGAFVLAFIFSLSLIFLSSKLAIISDIRWIADYSAVTGNLEAMLVKRYFLTNLFVWVAIVGFSSQAHAIDDYDFPYINDFE